MKNLALTIFWMFAVSVGLFSCETHNTERVASDAAEAIEKDMEKSADSLEVNTERAIKKTKEATKEAAAEIKEGAQKVENRLDEKETKE